MRTGLGGVRHETKTNQSRQDKFGGVPALDGLYPLIGMQ